MRPPRKCPFDDARLQLHDLAEVLDRQRFDLVAGDERRRRREVLLDQRAHGGDDDLLALEDLLAHLHVDRPREVDVDADVLDARRLVADEREDEGVGVRPEPDDDVLAVEVGGGALRRAFDEDVDAGERLAGGGVGDGALDLAVLRERIGAEEDGEGKSGEGVRTDHRVLRLGRLREDGRALRPGESRAGRTAGSAPRPAWRGGRGSCRGR